MLEGVAADDAWESIDRCPCSTMNQGFTQLACNGTGHRHACSFISLRSPASQASSSPPPRVVLESKLDSDLEGC